jgi:hypothetical protein
LATHAAPFQYVGCMIEPTDGTGRGTPATAAAMSVGQVELVV